jgi:hypothetical protein
MFKLLIFINLSKIATGETEKELGAFISWIYQRLNERHRLIRLKVTDGVGQDNYVRLGRKGYFFSPAVSSFFLTTGFGYVPCGLYSGNLSLVPRLRLAGLNGTSCL